MNWLKAVSDTSSAESLLAIVNDYLLQQSDEFWSWIPRGSRPTLVAGFEDIHEWHRKLTLDLDATRSPNIRMQDLCVFFVRASVRALEIDETARQETPSNEREFAGATDSTASVESK